MLRETSKPPNSVLFFKMKKIDWRGKRLGSPSQYWRKKTKARDFTLSNFKTYSKATVIRTAWQRWKSRHGNPHNRTVPGSRLTNVVDWFLTKEQRQLNGRRTVLSTNGAGTVGFPQVPYGLTGVISSSPRSRGQNWIHWENTGASW